MEVISTPNSSRFVSCIEIFTFVFVKAVFSLFAINMHPKILYLCNTWQALRTEQPVSECSIDAESTYVYINSETENPVMTLDGKVT